MEKNKKKVSFDKQSHFANSTLDLHQNQQFHSKISSIKKYQSTQNTYQQNFSIQDQDLFRMVKQFISRLIVQRQYCQQIIRSTNFQKLKSMEDTSSNHNVLKAVQNENKQINNKNYMRRLSKKVSIFVEIEQESNSSDSWHNSQIFQQKNNGIKNRLQLPLLKLTVNLIKQIFIIPSLFLMNLSVCLVLKYCSLTKTTLDHSNVGWLLCISSIISYKIYYDEQFEDLLQSFQDVIKLPIQQIIQLERIFLEGIDYRVIISSAQYQYVVARMLESNKQSRGNA